MSIIIESLHRYPVKSMGGHSLNSAQLGEFGIPGDRCWSLQDTQRRDLKIGKRNPKLMAMSASLLGEPDAATLSPPIEIDLGDGNRARSDDPEINAKLSQALGQDAILWPLLPKEQLDHYRHKSRRAGGETAEQPDPASLDKALREVFARTPDEPLPDLSVFPPELFEFETPPGTYFDAFPLLLVSNKSFEALSNANANANFDKRRFRPNIIIDTPAGNDGYIENTWTDKRARLGNAILQMHMPCPRCIMTTHGFNDLEKDPSIMRTLVQENDGNLGVYASVLEPGEIRVGDQLEWID